MYGVTVLQTYIYWIRFAKKDSKRLRALVPLFLKFNVLRRILTSLSLIGHLHLVPFSYSLV